ncbi:MAG: isocitrate lyase/phosphoenolpyruvate mutase family protein [Acidobacteriia bacterium]|nr:isocitrate lyase/phosphoenolpyruvate mutase family protein [Terriglobia bacterium]
MTQSEKAQRLYALHHAPDPLILVNAWDAASACIVEQAGFPAIATTSAGLANALGKADGQNLSWQEMLAAIQRIAHAVQAPVTADIEAGFAIDPSGLEHAIEEVIGAGAVGVNLEDALPGYAARGPLFSVSDQVARIEAVRRAGEKHGMHLVINARTDAWWQSGVTPEEAMRNTLERGKAYLQAGADCIFIPGLKNADQIRAIVRELTAPVNILAVEGAPSIPELKALGVRRISFGSGPMRAAMGFLRKLAQEAMTAGTYELMVENAIPYAEINGLFK